MFNDIKSVAAAAIAFVALPGIQSLKFAQTSEFLGSSFESSSICFVEKDNATRVILDFPSVPDGLYLFRIHDSPIEPNGNCTGVGEIFNPRNVTDNGNSTQIENHATGDLSGKHGMFTGGLTEGVLIDPSLRIGEDGDPTSILGRSIVISNENGTVLACANILAANSTIPGVDAINLKPISKDDDQNGGGSGTGSTPSPAGSPRTSIPSGSPSSYDGQSPCCCSGYEWCDQTKTCKPISQGGYGELATCQQGYRCSPITFMCRKVDDFKAPPPPPPTSNQYGSRLPGYGPSAPAPYGPTAAPPTSNQNGEKKPCDSKKAPPTSGANGQKPTASPTYGPATSANQNALPDYGAQGGQGAKTPTGAPSSDYGNDGSYQGSTVSTEQSEAPSKTDAMSFVHVAVFLLSMLFM